MLVFVSSKREMVTKAACKSRSRRGKSWSTQQLWHVYATTSESHCSSWLQPSRAATRAPQGKHYSAYIKVLVKSWILIPASSILHCCWDSTQDNYCKSKCFVCIICSSLEFPFAFKSLQPCVSTPSSPSSWHTGLWCLACLQEQNKIWNEKALQNENSLL